MKCKRCGAQGCTPVAQTTQKKRDFRFGRALAGSIFFGKAGAAFGLTGAKELDIQSNWVCPRCGYKF